MPLSKSFRRNFNPLWVVAVFLVLGAIGWAQDNIEAQANKSAANAGTMTSNLSMASMDSIKPPQATPSKPAPPVNWSQEKAVRNNLAQQEKNLNGLITRGNNEQAANGTVSSGLASQLRTAAQNYLETSQQYSKIWSDGKCVTRAKLAQEAGQAMVDSVELLIAGADGDRISAANKSQDRLNEARSEYFKEVAASGELSAADKADITRNLVPRANQLVKDAAGLVTEVTKLLDSIRSQAQSMASPGAIVGGVTACAGGGGSGPESIATKLLSPVTNLLSLAKGIGTSAQSLLSDIALLK